MSATRTPQRDRTTVALPREMVERVRAYGKQDERTLSQEMRFIVDQWLRRRDAEESLEAVPPARGAAPRTRHGGAT